MKNSYVRHGVRCANSRANRRGGKIRANGEEILFPQMVSKNEMLDGIIDELIEHHEDFREHVKRIEQELEAGDFAAVQQVLSEYLDSLLDHIAIENDELFQMAETLFMENELDDIYFRMLDKDRELGLEKKKILEGSIGELFNLSE